MQRMLSYEIRRVCFVLLGVIACLCECTGNGTDECLNSRASLKDIRKKRYLTFPDGSNFVMTLSLVKAFMTHVPSGWNTVIDIDVLFPLPDAAFSRAHRRRLHGRQKRDVWQRMEAAFDFHNLNGRSCLLRSICEARHHLAPPGKSLVHDIIRAIFSVPAQDEGFNSEVRPAFEELQDPDYCSEDRGCSVSLLQFLLALNKQ